MAKMLPPVTPGEVLQSEFMDPLDLSANKLASALGVPTNRITEILHGDRGITADTALRLSRCFGNTPEFWLNLQTLYDLEVAKREKGKVIQAEVRPIKTSQLAAA